MSATKERPILFSGEMVRAILAGTKTQTRRVVKPQPEKGMAGYWHPCSAKGVPTARALHYANEGHLRKGLPIDLRPFGQPGDRLWVRETWSGFQTPRGSIVSYRASTDTLVTKCGWRPSIHMPRWASRITLELTGVRVERLQDCSEEDAKAEGAAHRIAPGGDLAGAFDHCDTPIGYRNHFRDLWDSLDAKRGYDWASNPWVWVLSFARVEVKEVAA